MFVVGAGLSTLEVGADNFLAICGPPRYSEIRLNLAQGIQGVGSFVAPLLASRVFFAKTIDDAAGLKNVQWVYLGVACFVALLIILFYLAPMPEVTDADMNLQETDIAGEEVGPLRKQYNLFLGVWSQFCYVGAQVAVANFFIDFCVEAGYEKAFSCKCAPYTRSRLLRLRSRSPGHWARCLRLQSVPRCNVDVPKAV
jgi:FHS family L-fucose permease-like MFS transporter